MVPGKRVCTAVSAIAFAVLVGVWPATAQTTTTDGFRNAHRLGGSTSFYKPPVTTAAAESECFLRAGKVLALQTVGSVNLVLDAGCRPEKGNE
jgi:hypothetical protein